jgi:putative CocE/NonD family hydrolase
MPPVSAPTIESAVSVARRCGVNSQRRVVPVRHPIVLLRALLFCTPSLLSAQVQVDSGLTYDQSNAMIPMRDGARLYTDLYTPRGSSGSLPIILLRTPYGVSGAGERVLRGYLKDLARDGYVFALQDIRGRFKSDGRFVMQRMPRANRADPQAIDEATDAYDTMDWLVKNVAGTNGRVGMLGVSYDGWLTAMALLDPHPAFQAASPQASPADMFLGDDFHHNGAFRLSYGFEYAALLESSDTANTQLAFDRYDTYEWYLRLGPLSTVNAKYFQGKLPTWNDFVNHPNYDDFWKRQTITRYLTRDVAVPTMHVAGWWDQEDFYGPLAIYWAMERHDPNNRNFLVVGPWNHGGWSRGDGRQLGPIDFDSATARQFRERIQAPFFAHYLKDQGRPDQPEALTWESGANRWRSFDRWPPREATVRDLFFRADGKLSFGAPTDTGRAFDQYVSDPAHPVPYRNRPIEPTYYPQGSGWYTWLLQDQRFVDGRPDVLSWATDPLEQDVVVAGDIVAHLFGSTSGSDADWVVKLIDVYPEAYPKNVKQGGYQLMVSNEVFRGRFRRGFEHPVPLVPGQVNEFVVDIHSQDYRFLQGHRIMVQVQSTWFPIIDRNPQTFVPNIFAARPSDFRAQTHRVWRSARFPSHIALPVLPN